jgi:universal stress protein E
MIRRIRVAPGSGFEQAQARAAALARELGASLSDAGSADVLAPVDLLVLVPPRDGASQCFDLAHADRETLRHSACPVLLTRGDARPYRTVLVAVDPMHSHDKPAALDDRLVVQARQLVVADAASQVLLLHCHRPDEYLPMRAPGSLQPPAHSPEAHRRALNELAARHAIPADAVLLEVGDPCEAIAEAAARRAADLVVMGAISRSRIGRFLIGSTTESVLGRLACDVLAVPPLAAS